MRAADIKIRKSSVDDLSRMTDIYTCARKFMKEAGNSTQWGDGYPNVELLRDDIGSGISYVIEVDRRIVGTFVFIIGKDPTYAEIQGEWLDDEPYGTIHRLASDGTVKGIADACLAYCCGIISNIRVDTHKMNRVMLKWIARSGFRYCGVIHVADGSPREAFQLKL